MPSLSTPSGSHEPPPSGTPTPSTLSVVPGTTIPVRASDVYTRPGASSQYTNPIVTVHRHGVRPPPTTSTDAARPPPLATVHRGTPPTTSPAPPFIISNALAAANGLGPSTRRTSFTPSVAPPLVSTPPSHTAASPARVGVAVSTPAPAASPAVPGPAPAARVPPQKDLVGEDPELAQQRARTQERYRARLAQDHARILSPDLKTPFRSWDDMVQRLLPYHVWHLPEKDLIHAMEATVSSATKESQNDVDDDDDDENVTFSVPYKRARLDAEASSQDTPSMRLALPPFPSATYTASVYERRAQLAKRFAALQTRSATTYDRAPSMQASLEHWERLLYEDELKTFQDLSAELRRARSELEELERQRPGRLGLPLSSVLPGNTLPMRDWSTSASPTLPMKRPGDDETASAAYARASPTMARTPHDVRPPYPSSTFAPGTMPAYAGMPSRGPPGPMASPGNAISAGAPPIAVAGSSGLVRPPPSQPGNATQGIPTQPLPLVVPMTCVPRLTALGIHLVPASHLLPALSLASAGQSIAMNPGLTAPRPVVGLQTEPVMLVGITEVPLPSTAPPPPPGTSAASRQRLHLSVVLSKLRPEQLSGLAQIMQTVQTDDEASAGSAPPPVTSSPSPSPAPAPAPAPAPTPPPPPSPSSSK